MKRRSKGSGQRQKAKRPNAPKLKRRTVPKRAISRAASDVGQHEEIQQLARQLKEALRRETATSDVLEVISHSSGELEPVFQAILEKAIAICDAKLARCFDLTGKRFALPCRLVPRQPLLRPKKYKAGQYPVAC
jgi:hypothetical protein